RNIAKIVLYPGGVAAVINPADRRFEGTVKLFPGKNLVRAVAFDRSGRTMELRRHVVFSDKPAEIKFGQFAKAVRDRSALVRGNVISETPLKTLTVFPGSQPVSVDKTTGAFSATVMLSSFGENSLLFKAEDASGRVVSAEVMVFLDNEGPAISVDLLPEFIADSVVNISGTVQSADLSEVTVSPQGAPVSLDAKRQKFSVVRKLREGRNVFSVTASDTLKNITQKQVVITRDVVKPRLAPVSVASVVTTDSYSFTGRFDEENIATIKIEPGGITAEIDTATFSYTAVLKVSDGDNIFNVTATDKAGNFSMSRISLVARLEKQENVLDRLKKKIEMLEKQVDSLKAVKEPKKQK
ncbi:MAG: hypothetical protein JNL74_01950, partial [Fibrobacteres bacterium]|nr:hypothetical protein [Fibrobacterota bacterium]